MASEADLNTELLIRERLRTAYPDDAFFGEETGLSTLQPDQGIWVVDPIDGTQPYISGMSGWCVSIAFVQAGRLEFGMVYAPARDELFSGAGLQTNDFLANDGLRKGNPLIAGKPAVYAELINHAGPLQQRIDAALEPGQP